MLFCNYLKILIKIWLQHLSPFLSPTPLMSCPLSPSGNHSHLYFSYYCYIQTCTCTHSHTLYIYIICLVCLVLLVHIWVQSWALGIKATNEGTHPWGGLFLLIHHSLLICNPLSVGFLQSVSAYLLMLYFFRSYLDIHVIVVAWVKFPCHF